MATNDEEAPLLGGSADAPPSLQNRVNAALASPKALNGLERLLAAGVVLFVLLTATGFGLFAGEAVKLGQQHDGVTSTVTHTHTATATAPHSPPTAVPPSPPRNPGNDELCLTATCVNIASQVLTALDETVDPCEDFYLYSNGGWLKNHPIPAGKPMYGSAQDIDTRNKRIILSIIEDPISPDLPEADKDNINHLKAHYSSCLDEDTIDAAGIEPLLDVVKEIVAAWRGEAIVGPRATEDGQVVMYKKPSGRYDPKTRRTRLTSAFSYLHSRDIPAIFEVYPEGDVEVNPKDLVLWFAQSGLGLPSKDYYSDKSTVAVYHNVSEVVLEQVYDALGEPEVDTKALAAELIDFEVKLAAISKDPADLDDPKETYNSKNSTELQDLLPIISFKDYFASFTPRPAFPDPVIVTDPKYVKKVSKLLDGTEEDVLEAYFVVRAAQASINQAISKLDNFIGGIPEGVSLPRADVCLQSLLDNYGFLVGRYFVQIAFAGDSKAYAEEVIVATIEAFKDRLPELDWLDEETRKAAEEKADAITYKIGYPTNPNTEDPVALGRYYSLNLPISGTDYFGNVLRSRLADQRRTWVRVGGKQDKGIWEMIPSEVNAYYEPSSNEIAFPAGILQSPYFDTDWPEYLSFGVFGSTAGHELSHAFDEMGRQYDKDGKLTDWWTNATVERFTQLQGCFLDQYKKYSVVGPDGELHYINSKFTRGEDLADNGGLAQSFRAWTDRFDSDKNGTRFDNSLLPGLAKFSREQLFYIAYAQGWARNIKPAEAVRRIRVDPHSPTNYRVIGALSNNEDFSKAFGCKAGQRMSNVDKCHIW
ncbi:endothelin-converting enzyme, metalloendopeptidase [Pseudohyphozyma bogoriensis]|nr:endothelin-converting enzyme, metalloendopeptidase [Pseudohyphozyma bogoriensis]